MLSTEKVAYLKGLADGLELGTETKQDKLINAIIGVLETVAKDIEALNTMDDDLAAEMDAISDDLSDVEQLVYGDDCCCCDDDYDDECCCGDEDAPEEEHECCCGHHHDEEPVDEEAEHHCCGGHGHHHDHGEGGCGCGHHHGHLYDITCPGCQNHMTIDDHVIAQGRVQCPACGAMLEFEGPDEPEEAPAE